MVAQHRTARQHHFTRVFRVAISFISGMLQMTAFLLYGGG
jgi:hypothetical protein